MAIPLRRYTLECNMHIARDAKCILDVRATGDGTTPEMAEQLAGEIVDALNAQDSKPVPILDLIDAIRHGQRLSTIVAELADAAEDSLRVGQPFATTYGLVRAARAIDAAIKGDGQVLEHGLDDVTYHTALSALDVARAALYDAQGQSDLRGELKLMRDAIED